VILRFIGADAENDVPGPRRPGRVSGCQVTEVRRDARVRLSAAGYSASLDPTDEVEVRPLRGRAQGGEAERLLY